MEERSAYQANRQPQPADPEPDYIRAARDLAARAPAALQTLVERRAKLIADLAEVDKLGWTDAQPHYRDGRYLYLIHPTPRNGENGGKRKKEYIGADPQKQQEALARVERRQQHYQLADQLAETERRLTRGRDTLQAFYRALDGKSGWSW